MDPRLLLFLSLTTLLLAHTAHAKVTKASATVYKAVSSESDSVVAMGSIEFVDDSSGQVHISGRLTGLQPEGNHGFHVHELGALFNNCMAAGSHFNPGGKQHGGPKDSERHVGDLGNVVADVSLSGTHFLNRVFKNPHPPQPYSLQASGNAVIDISDTIVALNGPNSIVGRSIVVHEKPDDLGKADTADSKKTGSAGKRLGCGIIGTDQH